MKYRVREHHGKFYVEVPFTLKAWFADKMNHHWGKCNVEGTRYTVSDMHAEQPPFNTLQEAKDQIAIFEKPDKIHEV